MLFHLYQTSTEILGGSAHWKLVNGFWSAISCYPLFQPSFPPIKSANLPIYRSTNLPIYQVCQSANLPIYQSTKLPIYQSANLPIYQFVNLPICQSVNLPMLIAGCTSFHRKIWTYAEWNTFMWKLVYIRGKDLRSEDICRNRNLVCPTSQLNCS